MNACTHQFFMQFHAYTIFWIVFFLFLLLSLNFNSMYMYEVQMKISSFLFLDFFYSSHFILYAFLGAANYYLFHCVSHILWRKFHCACYFFHANHKFVIVVDSYTKKKRKNKWLNIIVYLHLLVWSEIILYRFSFWLHIKSLRLKYIVGTNVLCFFHTLFTKPFYIRIIKYS